MNGEHSHVEILATKGIYRKKALCYNPVYCVYCMVQAVIGFGFLS